MRYAHIADVHIGAWREPKLRDANLKAFLAALDVCVQKEVKFILIAGDLFNTSLPALDHLKEVVHKLKEMKEKNIPVYIIAGSHDYSPSGRTMLDVLERAGLFVNVARASINEHNKIKLQFTVDERTRVKITGLPGRKGQLEKQYYENLDRVSLEQEGGYKIFMFHTSLHELRPKELSQMDAISASLLPGKFDYYAGGHVHIVDHTSLSDHNLIVYPGPLFPNTFKELEDLKTGGFYIVEYDPIKHSTNCHYEPLTLYPVKSYTIDCIGKTPEQATQLIMDTLASEQVKQSIVTLRLTGVLETGRVAEVDLQSVFLSLYERGAYLVLKSTTKLSSKELDDVVLSHEESAEVLEESLLQEHAGQVPLFEQTPEQQASSVKQFMQLFDKEKHEGERQVDFEQRVISEASAVFDSL